jgi:hypothetical protein
MDGRPNNGKQGVNEECRKEAWLACNLNMEIFILFTAMTTWCLYHFRIFMTCTAPRMHMTHTKPNNLSSRRNLPSLSSPPSSHFVWLAFPNFPPRCNDN